MFKKLLMIAALGGSVWCMDSEEASAQYGYGHSHYSSSHYSRYPGSNYGRGCNPRNDYYAMQRYSYAPPIGYYGTIPYSTGFGGFSSGYQGFSGSVPFGGYGNGAFPPGGSWGGGAFPPGGSYGSGAGLSLWLQR